MSDQSNSNKFTADILLSQEKFLPNFIPGQLYLFNQFFFYLSIVCNNINNNIRLYHLKQLIQAVYVLVKVTIFTLIRTSG